MRPAKENGGSGVRPETAADTSAIQNANHTTEVWRAWKERPPKVWSLRDDDRTRTAERAYSAARGDLARLAKRSASDPSMLTAAVSALDAARRELFAAQLGIGAG